MSVFVNKKALLHEVFCYHARPLFKLKNTHTKHQTFTFILKKELSSCDSSFLYCKGDYALLPGEMTTVGVLLPFTEYML